MTPGVGRVTRPTGRQTDRHAGRQASTNRPTETQTDRHINRQTRRTAPPPVTSQALPLPRMVTHTGRTCVAKAVEGRAVGEGEHAETRPGQSVHGLQEIRPLLVGHPRRRPAERGVQRCAHRQHPLRRPLDVVDRVFVGAWNRDGVDGNALASNERVVPRYKANKSTNLTAAQDCADTHPQRKIALPTPSCTVFRALNGHPLCGAGKGNLRQHLVAGAEVLHPKLVGRNQESTLATQKREMGVCVCVCV